MSKYRSIIINVKDGNIDSLIINKWCDVKIVGDLTGEIEKKIRYAGHIEIDELFGCPGQTKIDLEDA